MKTKLFQEEGQEIGGGARVLTAEERAGRVYRLITDVIESGAFQIFKMTFLSVSPEEGSQCFGCAIGALAYSLGTRERCAYREITMDAIARREGGLINPLEVEDLECGFMNWTRGGAYNLNRLIDPQSPFFLAGKRIYDEHIARQEQSK